MSCFPCFSSHRTKRSNSNFECGSPSKEPSPSASPENKKQKPRADPKNNEDEINQVENGNSNAQTFTFRDLATATNNFRQECLLGEGGFGRVYKGTLKANGQVVAVKQFDRNGMQGNKEFLVEVQMLSLLHHPNLVNLIGHCADGDQRLLVYEYISGGSLEDRLRGITPEKKTLDWFTRMKIALGAANGLEYLHDKANPPVIYRDLKSSNILLDEGLCPKLSDVGLTKLGPAGDKMHISPRVMGTYGYCAPEYSRTGQLTLKSDIYSFGVVMLELITGRRAIDTTRPNVEQNLVTWAQPFFRDPKKFPDMADPLLNKQFPERSLNQAVAIAAMCLQEEAEVRPLIGDVVATLSFLSMVPEEGLPAPVPAPNSPSKEKSMNEGSSDDEDRDSAKPMDEDTSDHQNGDNAKHQDGDTSDSEDGDSSDYEDDESVDPQDKDSDGSVSSSHKSSRRSHNGSVTSSCKSSRGSQKQIASLSHKSSRKSSSRKSSRKSRDQSVSLSRKASTRSSDGSVSSGLKSNKGSRNRSVSSGRSSSSRGSKDGGVSVGQNSTVGSKEGSDSFGRKSSWISQDGSICFDHSNSRESDNGSIHLP